MKITIATPQTLYETGRRDNQEDALWPGYGQATAGDRVFVVCDGMGGHAHGEVASQTAAESVGRYVSEHLAAGQTLPEDLLDRAFEAAYDELDKKDNPADLRKMGTTLTLLCLHRGGATMANIGDSRIYHVRPSERRALYISRDHSLVMDLYLAGHLRWEEMGTHKRRHLITRVMMPHQEQRSFPDIVHTTDIQPGDLFLLCSDGVLEQPTDAQLMDILCADTSDEERMQRLSEATAQAGDNHSAYLIRIAGVEREERDAEALHDEDSSHANLIVLQRMLYDVLGRPKV